MLILENNDPPMRKLIQPWKLCRSFGSQPVGSSANSTWPEAGIAAQVIPAQPSHWTFDGKGDVPCRPADLPTCRPADLPTCRPADLPTWLADDHRGGNPLSPLAAVQALPLSSNTQVGDIARRRSSRPRQTFQGPVIVRTSPSMLLVSSIFSILRFPIETATSPKIPIAIKRLNFRFSHPAIPTP